MASLTELKKWMHQHKAEVREDFFRFLRFKSISNDPDCKKEMSACSHWVRDYFVKKIGMKAECIETVGYPLVYAEDLRAGPDAPTLLIYGHYDVQPVDPIELWKSDPFEPTERDGLVYARGTADDKGQILYAMLAAKAWKDLGRELPVNLKFCIEGEEESSSIGLANAIPKMKDKFSSDYLLVPDFGQIDRENPAISLGARGLVCLEVALIGSNSDLHSGVHGGMAYNPNRALAELLSKLWDENGKVRVPHFYEDVLEPSAEDLKQYAVRFEKEKYQKEFGIGALGGEKGRNLAEANVFRPTLEINGMGGGYIGPGFKTVIPAQAIAKISCRLVPNQDPEKIARGVVEFLKKNTVPGMKVKTEVLTAELAFRGNPNSQLAKAVSLAVEEATGKKCHKILSGGSIPIIATLAKATNAEIVGMGFGLPEDNIHAPNENFDFDRIEKGFLTVARTLELL